MTSDFLATKRRFTIDGIDVTNLVDITVDEQGPKFDAFDVLDDVYGRQAELTTDMASGSVRIKARDNSYGNDPMNLSDFFSLAFGYSQYDTATGIVSMVFDTGDQTTPDLMGPKRIVELRQTEAATYHYISDSGAVDEAWAQSFIAAGEDINLIRLKLFDKVATKVESFDLEIWTDNVGVPNAQLALSNTVTVHASAGADDATNDYIGALTTGVSQADATWETVDMSANLPNIMGTAVLTIGTTYWLVIRNVLDADDDLGVCYTTAANNENGVALQDDDVTAAPAWGDAPAGTADLTYIIQFEAAEGHEVRIYDYKSATAGFYTNYEGVRFFKAQVKPAAQKTTESTINWTAQSITGPVAF